VNGKIFFCRRSRECYSGANILWNQGWKVRKNFFRRIAGREAGEHGAK
jgi:hypothetical protein